MRITHLAIAALVLFSSICFAAKLQPLPKGPYRSSCQQCTYKNHTLKCHCINLKGHYKRTRIANTLFCRNRIFSYNGKLHCVIPPTSRLPRGQYLKSCHNCRYGYAKAWLACHCPDDMHHTQYSLLINTAGCYNIHNRHGRLTCF